MGGFGTKTGGDGGGGGVMGNICMEQATLLLTTFKIVYTFGPTLGASACSTDSVSSGIDGTNMGY